jgi:hypothetical protein
MGTIIEPQTSGFDNVAQCARGIDPESKAKPGRFCASFMDFFPLEWINKVFHPANSNASTASGTPSVPHENAAAFSLDARPAELADDDFFRVQSTGIRHSLSLGENTVRVPNQLFALVRVPDISCAG